MTVGKHHVKEVLSDDLKLSRVGALQMLGGREFQVLAAKVFFVLFEGPQAHVQGLQVPGWSVLVEEVRKVFGDWDWSP